MPDLTYLISLYVIAGLEGCSWILAISHRFRRHTLDSDSVGIFLTVALIIFMAIWIPSQAKQMLKNITDSSLRTKISAGIYGLAFMTLLAARLGLQLTHYK